MSCSPNEPLRVIGRPDREIRFKRELRFCPACGSGRIDNTRWYAKDGRELYAECLDCCCHFGVSGVGVDPDDPDEGLCEHAWAEGIEPDGVTPSGHQRCFLCGERREEQEV